MCQHTKINNLIGACLFSVLKYELINTEQISQIQITILKYEKRQTIKCLVI